MRNDARILTVLIASPGEMEQHRSTVEQAILDWSITEALQHGIVFIPQRWERDASSEIAEDSDAQDVINRQLVDGADCLISLWWNRLGTKTRRAESGTAEEVQRHVAAGKPCSAYFCKDPIPLKLMQTDEAREQMERLEEFRNSYLNERGLVEEFQNGSDLRDRIRQRLGRWARDIVMKEAENRRDQQTAAIIVESVPTTVPAGTPLSTPAPAVTKQQALRHFVANEAREYAALLESTPFRAATPSEAALAIEQQMAPSLGRVAQIGTENRSFKSEVAPLVVEWMEALAIHPSQGGLVWKNAIRGYGGYLLFRTLMLSELCVGSAHLAAIMCKKWVYTDRRGKPRPLLEALSRHNIFEDGSEKHIDADAPKRLTAVSDHVEPVISVHSTALSEKTTSALFDLSETLISLKQTQVSSYPDFGKYLWTSRSHHFIAEALREEKDPELLTYEQQAVISLFPQRNDLMQAAVAYDRHIAGGNRERFRIAYHAVAPLVSRSSPADKIEPWGEI